MNDNVNYWLQELTAEAREAMVNDEYEAMQDEYLCRMVAVVTMDDVGSEFDPKIA
jgi:hypothetical protein